MATVLIVEDDQLLREMYALKFELEGYDVLVAEDGQMGLEQALTHQPHVIILDNLMPRLSGLEMLAKLAEQRPDHGACIIVLSNKSDLADTNHAKQLGARDYLVKSQFAPADIVIKVQEYLSA